MLRECPLYPWASSCFPGMMVQLKEQDHSNPMTQGSRGGSARFSPGKLQTLEGGPSHGSFGVVGTGVGGSPSGLILSLQTLSDLSCSILFPEHHPFICSSIHSLPLSCIYSLPSSLFAGSSISTVLFTEHLFDGVAYRLALKGESSQ